jgi:hypothetical protein
MGGHSGKEKNFLLISEMYPWLSSHPAHKLVWATLINLVQLVEWLGYGKDNVTMWGTNPHGDKTFISYPRHPHQIWGPPSLLFNWSRGSLSQDQSSGGMRLATHLHLESRLHFLQYNILVHSHRWHLLLTMRNDVSLQLETYDTCTTKPQVQVSSYTSKEC